MSVGTFVDTIKTKTCFKNILKTALCFSSKSKEKILSFTLLYCDQAGFKVYFVLTIHNFLITAVNDLPRLQYVMRCTSVVVSPAASRAALKGSKLYYYTLNVARKEIYCGRHSSVVSSAPTILRPRVRIPSTPSMLFSICIEIVTRKERK